MPRVLARQTITFRLWIALSVVAVVCTTLALSAYVWLTLTDNIRDSQTRTEAKIQAVALAAARLGGQAEAPSTLELATARSLGIEMVEVYDEQGHLLSTLNVAAGTPTGRPTLEPGVVATVLTSGRSQSLVRIEPGSFQPENVSALDLIKGGHFGEEEILPLSAFFPDRTGVIRVTAAFGDLSAEAHSLILLSLAAGAVIVGTLLLSVWVFLRRFVAVPLSRYSRLAIRIAQGETVRMPVSGDDEMSQLARAVNGMADALQHQATVDDLTGLYNLRHLSSNLEALIAQAAQNSQPLSVIFGDLDNLKSVNDTYGHEAGDAVLRAVGETLRSWGGQSYTCWRLGGDEFVLALPNVSGVQALGAADAICDAVNATLVPIGDTQIRPSISVGIATYPQDGTTAGTLLGMADRGMYTVKAVQHRDERRMAGSPAA